MIPILIMTLPFMMAQNLEAPRLVREAGLYLQLPADLLEIKEIEAQVDSGLTATLSLRYRLIPGRGQEGRTLITVRYEPWEEVYFVEQIQAAGRQQWTLAGKEALNLWWRHHRPQLFGDAFVGSGELRLVLEVIPFSEREQQQALDRFAKPEPVPFETGNRDSLGGGNAGSPAPSSEFLDLILKASAKRKVMFHFSWTLKY